MKPATPPAHQLRAELAGVVARAHHTRRVGRARHVELPDGTVVTACPAPADNGIPTRNYSVTAHDGTDLGHVDFSPAGAWGSWTAIDPLGTEVWEEASGKKWRTLRDACAALVRAAEDADAYAAREDDTDEDTEDTEETADDRAP